MPRRDARYGATRIMIYGLRKDQGISSSFTITLVPFSSPFPFPGDGRTVVMPDDATRFVD
jgi:hypothetical protein